MKLTVLNKTRGTELGCKIDVADTAWTRAKGLLGRSDLPEECGLLITPCNSIHMFFMRFAIDVAFLDESDKVVRAVHSIKPWRATWFYPGAVSALELPAGTLKRTKTEQGDQLGFFESEMNEETHSQDVPGSPGCVREPSETGSDGQEEECVPGSSSREDEIFKGDAREDGEK